MMMLLHMRAFNFSFWCCHKTEQFFVHLLLTTYTIPIVYCVSYFPCVHRLFLCVQELIVIRREGKKTRQEYFVQKKNVPLQNDNETDRWVTSAFSVVTNKKGVLRRFKCFKELCIDNYSLRRRIEYEDGGNIVWHRRISYPLLFAN